MLKAIVQASLIMMLLYSSVVKSYSHCHYHDAHTRQDYDLRYLVNHYAPHKLEVNILGTSVKGDYQFNFCNGPLPKCRNQHVPVTEFIEILGVENTQSCSVLGVTPTFHPFDVHTEGHGFSLLYTTDHNCIEYDTLTHRIERTQASTEFKVHCHPGSTSFEKEQMTSKRCRQIFRVFSPTGCPVGHPHHRFHLGRKVLKVLTIWFGLLSISLIIFAIWVDPDKTLFKSLHLVLSYLKNIYSQIKLRVKNVMRKRKARMYRKEESEEYTSMSKELTDL